MNNIFYGVAFSLMVHAVIFGIAMPTNNKVEYSLNRAPSSVEVSLVFFKDVKKSKTVKKKTIERKVKVIKVKPTIKQVVKIENKKIKKIKVEKPQKIEHKKDNTSSLENAISGVIMKAKPIERSSPAPIYPRVARERGYEGRVILLVTVDKNGKPIEIKLKKTSGYNILDKSAIKTVCKWQFVPATRNKINFRSKIEIPILFKLN